MAVWGVRHEEEAPDASSVLPDDLDPRHFYPLNHASHNLCSTRSHTASIEPHDILASSSVLQRAMMTKTTTTAPRHKPLSQRGRGESL